MHGMVTQLTIIRLEKEFLIINSYYTVKFQIDSIYRIFFDSTFISLPLTFEKDGGLAAQSLCRREEKCLRESFIDVFSSNAPPTSSPVYFFVISSFFDMIHASPHVSPTSFLNAPRGNNAAKRAGSSFFTRPFAYSIVAISSISSNESTMLTRLSSYKYNLIVSDSTKSLSY